MQSYFLDLQTLLQILSRQKRSGTLQAKNIRLAGVRGGVDIYIEIVQGTVRTCALSLRGNKLAEGQEAFQIVSNLGALEWLWAASTASIETQQDIQQNSPSRSLLPSRRQDALLYPQRTTQTGPRTSVSLSRNHRRTLALCDGTRSTEKIAFLLSISHEDVRIYLRELEAEGIIRYRFPSEKE